MMSNIFNQQTRQTSGVAMTALMTGIMTLASLTGIASDAKAYSYDMSCENNCATLQPVADQPRDDDGDDSEKRYWKPKWNGVRLDARMHIDANYDHPFVAHEFCNERGYSKASSYRVATAWKTIGRGDRHIFKNGRSSNTAFRYIHCAR